MVGLTMRSVFFRQCLAGSGSKAATVCRFRSPMGRQGGGSHYAPASVFVCVSLGPALKWPPFATFAALWGGKVVGLTMRRGRFFLGFRRRLSVLGFMFHRGILLRTGCRTHLVLSERQRRLHHFGRSTRSA